MLSVKAENITLINLSLTRQVRKKMIYHTRGEHVNYYTRDTILKFEVWRCVISDLFMRLVQLKRRLSTDSTIIDGQVIYQDMRGIIRIRKSKDRQRSTVNTHTTKDRLTRTPINTGDEGAAFCHCCNYFFLLTGICLTFSIVICCTFLPNW
jgi:hypothetical protein